MRPSRPARESSLEPPPADPEQDIIDTLLAAAPKAPPSVRIGPGDDAALVGDEALTVDTLVEGVHFDARLSPEDVGYKALAVSVSDLAAMGAHPAWALLALSLPRPVDHAWVRSFARGLGAACTRWGVALVGGDTTRSPGPRYVSLTLGGPCPHPVRRSGGGPGDALYVTGVPGLAAAGYALVDPPAEALAALRRPDPPLAFAQDVARAGLVTAMMDLSDGLATDLPRLARASGVGARVDASALPDHDVFASVPDPLALRLAGGDDYQLLLTARLDHDEALRTRASHHGVRLTRIGELTTDRAVALTAGAWPAALFAHFEGAS